MFHAAIFFLLDLCTIKTLNAPDSKSVCLCSFQYSADTKHFIVYIVSANYQSCASLSRKNITAKPLIAWGNLVGL